MDWRERIIADPKILTGKPVIKGTRLSVELVLDLLANGWTTDQIIEEYPGVENEDIRACMAYAKEIVQDERVFPAASA